MTVPACVCSHSGQRKSLLWRCVGSTSRYDSWHLLAYSMSSFTADRRKIWKQRLKSTYIPFYWSYVLVFSTHKWHLESMLQKRISIKHIGIIYMEMVNSLRLVKLRTVGFSEFRKLMWNLAALKDLCPSTLVHKFSVFIFVTCAARAQATIQGVIAPTLEFALGLVFGLRQWIKLIKQKG